MLASQSFRNVSRAPIRALGQALSSLASAPALGPKFARKRWQKPPANRRVKFAELGWDAPGDHKRPKYRRQRTLRVQFCATLRQQECAKS